MIDLRHTSDLLKYVYFNVLLIFKHFVDFWDTLLFAGGKVTQQSIQNSMYNNLLLSFKWRNSHIFQEK